MTEVFGTAGRLLTFHCHVTFTAQTTLHSGHLNIYHSFTSITATGDDWLCRASLARAKQNPHVHNLERGMKNTDSHRPKPPYITARCPPFSYIARMTKTR